MFQSNLPDPAGLIARAPILEAIAMQDRLVSQALSRGDPFAVYEALQKRLKVLRPGTQEALELKALLLNRRAFVRPASPPTLFRLNTIGTSLFFEHEREDDGTYIGTQCFSALFAPLAPLAQYLVQSAESGGWYFLGEVPLSDGMRWWRRIFGGLMLASLLLFLAPAALAMAGVGGSSSSFFASNAPQAVYLVNGLDVPVRVEVEGVPLADGGTNPGVHEVFVGPGERPVVSVHPGRRMLRAFSVEGEEVDAVDLQAGGGVDFVAFNIVGAAPLYAEGVHYGAKTSALPQNPIEEYAGVSLVVRDDIPYVFQDPPSEVTMGKYETIRTLWTVNLDPDGWKHSARNLRFLGKRKEAGELVARVVLLDSAALYEAWNAAADLTAGGSPADALSFARKLDTLYPHDAYVTELLLTYLQGSGREEEARTLFTERARENPENWQLQWLAHRTLEANEQAKQLQRLIEGNPSESLLLRSYAGLLRRMGKHASALQQHERARSLGFEDRPHEIADQLRSWVALGKLREAQAYANELGDSLEVIDWPFAIDYARLARLSGEKAPDFFLDEYLENSKARESDLALARIFTGQDVTAEQFAAIGHEPTRRSVELTHKSVNDLDAAIAFGRSLPVDVIARTDIEVVVLLACEFARLGEAEVAQRYFSNDAVAARAQPALEAFIREGKTVPLWNNLRPEFRAAALLSRARSVTTEKERRGLLERVKLEDVLRGPVALAAGTLGSEVVAGETP